MALVTFSNQTFRNAELLEENLARLPGDYARFLALWLAREGKKFITDFRKSLDGKFKVRRTKAGNAFKWFVDGMSAAAEGGKNAKINGLRMRSFTSWIAAPVYEEGKTITARGGMAIPANPKAFTSDGRIKRRWHDPANFPGLVMIKTKRGVHLLVKPRKQIKQDGGPTTTLRGVYGKKPPPGAALAFEIYFIVLLGTARSRVLSFFLDFYKFAEAARARGQTSLEAFEAKANLMGAQGAGTRA